MLLYGLADGSTTRTIDDNFLVCGNRCVPGFDLCRIKLDSAWDKLWGSVKIDLFSQIQQDDIFA
ncbi:hypothetical protein NY78_2882 [Desulfovibrio sp. TomC]|nr:hypothetical protein NY78_2882 [Desulfovibrio sp. TomC]